MWRQTIEGPMASPTIRARQRAMVLERFSAQATALADALGIDPPVIPASHRDPEHLHTVRLEAIGAWLGTIADAVTAPVAHAETESEPVPAPVKAEKPPAKPAKARP